MKNIKLRIKILTGVLIMIFVWVMIMSAYGFFVLKKYVVGEAQKQINQDLITVRSSYNEKLNQMRLAFKFIDETDNLDVNFQNAGVVKDSILLIRAYIDRHHN